MHLLWHGDRIHMVSHSLLMALRRSEPIVDTKNRTLYCVSLITLSLVYGKALSPYEQNTERRMKIFTTR